MKAAYKVNWLLFFILILPMLGISNQLYFILTAVYLVFLLFSNRFNMVLPKITGLKIYCVSIVISVVVGLFTALSLRDVFRDIFYIVPTLLWVFCAEQLIFNSRSKAYSVLKTVFLYGVVVSVYSWISFFSNFTFEFYSLRAFFGYKVYDVGLILPVFILEVFFRKTTVFTKRIDRLSIILMTGQIMLSFGRVAILAPLLELYAILFILIMFDEKKAIYRKKLFAITISLISIIILISSIMPEEVLGTFVDKIEGSLTEIDTSQSINSVADAMHNWRAYENQATIEYWMESNIFAQVFGHGLGSGVVLDYVPYSWEGMLTNSILPLAHNGFATLLVKGGLLSMFSLIVIFVSPIFRSIKKTRLLIDRQEYCAAIVGLNLAAITLTYVVRGPVQQDVFLAWAVLLPVLLNLSHNEVD